MSEPSRRPDSPRFSGKRIAVFGLIAIIMVGGATLGALKRHQAETETAQQAASKPPVDDALVTPEKPVSTGGDIASSAAVKAVPPPPPASGNTVVPAGANFSVIAARLLPAVVNISTSSTVKPDPSAPSDNETPDNSESPFDEFFKDFGDQKNGGTNNATPPGKDQSRPQAEHPQKSMALGSGFIIDPAGLVVTNNHVIADADEITVILQDNTELKAQLVGRDVLTDLALLRVKADHKLPSVPWGDSDKVLVGDWVLAVGNPFGLGGTLTAGLISGRERAINNGGPYDEFLQTDASINRGNSGGPLFDLKGEVIGINSAIFSPSGGSIGLGFAIPSDLAKGVIAQLNQFGKIRRGWLGLRIEGADQDEAQVLGLDSGKAVLVGGVVPKSPAASAGIKPGDLIVGIDGKDVDTPHHLLRVIGDTAPGSAVKIALLRQRARQVIDVTAAPSPDDDHPVTSDTPEPPPVPKTTDILGLSLSPVSPELKQKFQIGEDAGIVVVGVDRGSLAAKTGMQAGDAILEAGQQPVKTPIDLASRLNTARRSGKKTVFLLIERKGDLRYLGLRVDKAVG